MRSLQKRYQRGLIPFTACRADPRFSYCLYVPNQHHEPFQSAAPLLVVVHGSARTAESFRDAFIEFAEQHGCVVLAPLFPVGAVLDGDTDGYKLQPPLGYRYDHLLLSMVEEVSVRFHTEQDFYLYGFSGGAQFAHRFLYLHPQRLKGTLVHAPGQVSMPLECGGAVDIQALQQVPVQLVVGSRDVGSGSLEVNRRALLRGLHTALKDLEVPVQWVEIEGAGHDGFALMPVGQRFLAELLQSRMIEAQANVLM